MNTKVPDLPDAGDNKFTLRLETVKEAALARLNHCSNEVSSQLLDSVRIVYRTVDGHLPEAIGTCFLLELDGCKYLVTAAHVFDFTKEHSVYVAGDETLVLLQGNFWVTPTVTGSRRADKHDFAFQVLTDEMIAQLGAVRFIDAHETSLNRGTMDGRVYLAMGFPASRNKPKKIDPSRTSVQARAWTYHGTLHTDGKAARLIGASEADHLLLKHNHKYSRTFGGHRTRSVKPQGASGGVLIDLGVAHPDNLRPNAPCTWRLAGMLVEKHSGCDAILVIRIEVVMKAMRVSRATSP